MIKKLFFLDNARQNIWVKVKNHAKWENNNNKYFDICLHAIFDPVQLKFLSEGEADGLIVSLPSSRFSIVFSIFAGNI